MAKKQRSAIEPTTTFRESAKATLNMVGVFVNATRRTRPDAFVFQLSPAGIRAAEHHLHQLWEILDKDALAPAVTPATRAACDRQFQNFLVLQGLKEASHG